jgi:hypothetical protein
VESFQSHTFFAFFKVVDERQGNRHFWAGKVGRIMGFKR